MFGRKPWDTAKDVLNNPTIPRFYFKGLALDDSEFIALRDLIELEKKEVYAKLLKLRDISNSMIEKDAEVIGVEYDEKDGPKLTIMFSDHITTIYNISQTTRLQGSRVGAPSYTINEDILNYLLANKNLKSKLDMMLVSDYIEELTAFKEALTDGTFYADYALRDTTGIFEVSVGHNGYHVEEVKDSISIPHGFGKVVAAREFSGGYGLNYSFFCSDNSANCQTNIEGTGAIRNADTTLYLHKKLLPEVVQTKLK